MTSPPDLRQTIRINAAGDVVGQLIFLVIAVFWVPSPWMYALWAVRWGVVGAIGLAWLAQRSGRESTALGVLVAGHVAGALGSVVILPEFVPVIVFALFGDLLLGVVFGRLRLRQLLAGCVLAIGVVAGLSLQSWTGLADSAPAWLVVLILGGHTAVTGVLASRQAQTGYDALRARVEELARLGDRIREAIDEERAEISRSLAAGPVADLDQLMAWLEGFGAELAAGPQEAAAAADRQATAAQQSLKSLRELSHGIFPDSLRLRGLSPSLANLAAGAPAIRSLKVPDRRFAPEVESAVYACVLDMVERAGGALSEIDVVIETAGQQLALEATIDDPGPTFRVGRTSGPHRLDEPEPRWRLTDRVAAAGGTVSLRAEGSALLLRASIPLEPASGPAHRDESEAAPSSEPDRMILERFLSSSVMLCLAGMVTVALVWLATRIGALVAIEVVLAMTLGLVMVARRATRASHYGVALVLVCAETSFAGLCTTALAPAFVPATALIAALPIVLALPYMQNRALNAVRAAQTMTLATVAVLAMTSRHLLSPASLPAWVTVSLVPLTTAAVATLVAVTVAATHAELATRTAALGRSLRWLVTAADQERRRLERDLHDGAQQHFVAASLQLRALARLALADPTRAVAVADQLQGQLTGARAELATLTDGAVPPALADGDLGAAVHRISAASALPVEVRVDPIARVPLSVALPVFYCCQEAVQNANKHAGPGSQVRVELATTAEGLSFEISDTGRGFDPAHASGGLGLRSLRERVAAAGGALEVRSSLGAGTTVRGLVPLTGAERNGDRLPPAGHHRS